MPRSKSVTDFDVITGPPIPSRPIPPTPPPQPAPAASRPEDAAAAARPDRP